GAGPRPPLTRPGTRPGFPPAGDQFAPDRLLKITITGASDAAVGDAINDRIQAILRAHTKGGPASFRSSRSNGTTTVTIGPSAPHPCSPSVPPTRHSRSAFRPHCGATP